MGVVHDSIEPKSNNTAINKAFQEDEAIKKASEQRSTVYLKDIKDREDKTPMWVWCVLWFVIGVLFSKSVEIINFYAISQYLNNM